MNALLEPWEDEALSEDATWGVPPALRQQQQAEALADTAASGAEATAAAADGGVPGRAADGTGAAADAAGAAANGNRGGVGGLAALAPGQELDLGITYRGPKVGGQLGQVAPVV